MGANVSGVGEELRDKVRGSSCIRLSSRLESIFHCPGLNYYKADRNYFIRSQRPQGCKCPMNKTLLVRSGSTAPFHHVSWILESTNQRSSGTLGFYRELLMRRRCEERKWKWIQRYKSIQRSFFNVSWSHSARHAPFLHHINGEKSNCYTVTTTHNCNLLIKRYLMVAIFLDDSSGFTWLTASKVHTDAFQKVCSNDKYPLDLSCHRWSLILSNGKQWQRDASVSDSICLFPSYPSSAAWCDRWNTRQQSRCHSFSREPETLQASQSPLRHRVFLKRSKSYF